ncbi:MAG TPA: hypothetical protein VMH22_13105 [bacterium]|nr:hypothetical protein [bacterium]
MNRSKTVLVALALTAIVLTAWADDNAAVNKPKSDKDNSAAVAPAQPAQQPDQSNKDNNGTAATAQPAAQPDKPDQSTQSRSQPAQPPQSSQSNPNYGQAPQSRPDVVREPNSPTYGQSEVVPQPSKTVVQPSDNQRTYHQSAGGDINVPQPGGNPRQGGGGGNAPGSGGGHNYYLGRSAHYYSGLNWHGRHEEWRYHHYHGDWGFLFMFGPTLYYAPAYYPSYVIRLPHNRVGVYINYTGNDNVGQQFANAVRQELSDEGLRVVYSQEDAQLELYVISMEQDEDNPGYNSSISVSYIWGPGHKFITSQMVDAGINEVNDLANAVASYTDDLIDQYR